MLEELKVMFFELCQKKQNLSDEQLLELKQASGNDLLPILEYFTENGGNPYFIIKDGETKLNLLNIAAEENSLYILNYLLDKEIFTLDQEASESTQTAFHSAVEGNQIEATKLLLKRGANINAIYLRHGESHSAIEKLFRIYKDENCIEYDYLEITKFLIKYGVTIPTSNYINKLCTDSFIQFHPNKGPIKDLLLSIKNLEDLYSIGQGDDFINAYKALDTETQEIWNIRQSRANLKKIANFIEEKFSKGTVAIEYKEYDHLRKYNSLPKYKKDALEIFLTNEKFTFNELITIVDNFVNNNFFKLARIADSLEGSDFELLGETIMPHITQYLKFEDSSVKIAGSNIDHH